MSSQTGAALSPYVELDRTDWARLSNEHRIDLTPDDVARLSSIHEALDLTEVEEVYLPISRLLTFYVKSIRDLHAVTSNFLGERPPPTPFIIGVAGSVAVGKSTTSRVLRELLSRWEESPRVQLVTTDGFLFPNDELERRGLLTRKGFPESYDRRALLRFVSAVKSGQDVVHAPVYSHLHYDIIPGASISVERPDVLILEGLNVLQPPRKDAKGVRGLAISDFFDFSVYVDARVSDIRSWYIERFLALRDSAFTNPHSYFHKFAGLTDETARGIALSLWESINYPNLRDNIVPTRRRASLVLTKGADHSVRTVRLRKL